MLDYYMNDVNEPGLGTVTSDFDLGKVELYRHGIQLGSNYLYMDGHVGTFKQAGIFENAADPWDFPDTSGTPVATVQQP